MSPGPADSVPEDFVLSLDARLGGDAETWFCRFKEVPEDFEVSEIDPNGSVVPTGAGVPGESELQRDSDALMSAAEQPAKRGAASSTSEDPVAGVGEKLELRDPVRAAVCLERVLGADGASRVAAAAARLPEADAVVDALPSAAKSAHERWLADVGGRVPALDAASAVSAPEDRRGRTLAFLACVSLYPHANVETAAAAAAPPGSAEAATGRQFFLSPYSHAPALRRTLAAEDFAPVLRAVHVDTRLPATERAGLRLRGSYPDKARRRELHQTFSALHRGLSSAAKDGSVSISWRGGAKARKRGRAEPRRHFAFTLEKRATEQHAALSVAAAALGVPLADISFRGNKDRAAVTRQRCVVAGVSAAAMAEACHRTQAGPVRIMAPAAAVGPLSIGQLGGNRFKIVLRGLPVAASDAALAARAAALAREGFVNFFGPQRVGYPGQDPAPWQIGAAVLRGDWAGAVALALTPNARDPPRVAEAKRALAAGADLVAVRDMLPRSAVREAALVKGLLRFGRERPLLALRMVPFHARTLWVAAFSARAFNAAADLRVRAHGARVVAGDLVIAPGERAAWRERVRRVTAEELTAGGGEGAWRPGIGDVVLPMPGDSVALPGHEVGTFLRSFLAEHGVDYGASPAHREGMAATLRGTYRRLVEVPTGVRWGRLGGDLRDAVEPAGGAAPGGDAASPLVVEFALREGCYATMALRQLVGAR